MFIWKRRRRKTIDSSSCCRRRRKVIGWNKFPSWIFSNIRINMLISLKQLWNSFSVLFLFRFTCIRAYETEIKQCRRNSALVISMFQCYFSFISHVRAALTRDHSITCHKHVYLQMEWVNLPLLTNRNASPTALWPILISWPTEDRRLSRPNNTFTRSDKTDWETYK